MQHQGRGSERSPERPIATVEQVDQLAATIDPRFKALVYVAIDTTLRKGELFALRRPHIDLEGRTISVVQQVSHLADGTLIVGPPKSAAGVRVVSIPASLLPEIEHHLVEYVGVEDGAPVFRGAKGAAPSTANWSKMWRKVTAAVGVEGFTSTICAGT